MSAGSDHSKDHALIVFALSFFVATQGIPANGHDACSYRKAGFDEFQQILAFAIATDGTTRRIQASQVFPGLRLAILEEALVRSRGDSQSATNAWLMQQFQG